MAEDIGVSASSMRRVVKQKLQLRSYRSRTAPLLTEEMKQIRLKRCKKLLMRFAEGSHRNIVFSDEKIFTVEPIVNSQNNRVLAEDIEQALSRGKIVVWSIVESKACSIRHQNLEELKAALTKAWEEMDSDYVRMTCDAFVKRLRRCVRAKGGHFE
ncbi:hypothetical protein ANCDUO_07824 [Ancylostoma duodenale]|uniref:Transposase n=1 Tax=Ancylostoma duodenale TaxID=51022 RepID=A0A0C2GXP5_9BILA|nr:hypothetical protein ANCDUO_07824 [Ancylostoma duodenale]